MHPLTIVLAHVLALALTLLGVGCLALLLACLGRLVY
ncbi:hypothetical protein M2394_004856 [Pseudomonas sp. BIGb0164]|jgi:hypothetical protein|nr:hypothetical protein [Pseudomonas sp. BIGb0164]